MFEIEAARILRRQVRFDAQRGANLLERRFVCLRERVAPVLRRVPAQMDERRARDQHRRADDGRAGLEQPAWNRDAELNPDRGDREARDDQNRRDEHGVERQQAVLKRRDDRHRTALSAARVSPSRRRGTELSGPSRSSVRMAAVDAFSAIEAAAAANATVRPALITCPAAITKISGVRRAAVELPQSDRRDRCAAADQPAGEQHERLGQNACERRHPLPQLELERVALSVAGDDANGDERQQEHQDQPPR
jgi:hypothetical protein